VAATESGARDARRIVFLRLALLWLIGADLRTVILAVPPVLPSIHHQLHLSETEVGLLTTLPVLLFGLGAVGGSAAVAKLGPRRTLVGGLFVVGAASALRGAGGTAILFGASVLLGLAIAVIQPALPTVAHAWFGTRVAFATAVYGNGFIVGEALAASLTLPLLVPLTGSWQGAIAVWSIPCGAVAALLLVLRSAGVPAHATGTVVGWSPSLGKAATWRLGLLQGGGSTLYFGTNAFLPTELHAVGHGNLVTACLASLNVSQLLAVLIIGALARRHAPTRQVMAVCGIVALVGIAFVAFWPGPLAVVGAGVIGLCSACCFVVALALPAVMVPPHEVHQISAGMLTIGYVLAFALPLLGGLVWDATGQPRASFIPAVIGASLFTLALAGRRRAGVPDPAARLG
jgi:MFS transporter, CP family, cyanate transporter